MKYKAVDLFCGAGGLSFGLKKGGFDVVLGIDIDQTALKTYKDNIKRAKVLNKDIKLVSGKEIEKITGIKKGDCFLLAGCPPCQGFSNLGKRDATDQKNKLVYSTDFRIGTLFYFDGKCTRNVKRSRKRNFQ